MNTEKVISSVTRILSEIIESNIDSFRENNSFKVRPQYGYGKFYLDWVEGSYDMSLQGLIHYIMYEEKIYKKFLNESQYEDLEKVIEYHPESIYGLDLEDEDYDRIQNNLLDVVYSKSIQYVAKKLIELDFDVKETFSQYLEDEK